MNNLIALIFPGQGSQSVGMGRELAEEYNIARDLFTGADNLLDIPISEIAWEGPEDQLNDTINTQPALFVHSIAALRILEVLNTDLQIKYVAGHSMGELSALVASKAISFEEGLKLVKTRGRLMKKAGELSPGSMAAVLGLDMSTLEQICDESSSEGKLVQVANDNCPGQVVISGDSMAIKQAMGLAKERGAKRVIPLAVSIAAHSPLMNSVQHEFNQAVDMAPISDPEIPIIGNVTALPLQSIDEIKRDLKSQLTHKVRWTESINYLLSENVSIFIEMGNGSVLSGLIKRINRDARTLQLNNPDDFKNLKLLFN